MPRKSVNAMLGEELNDLQRMVTSMVIPRGELERATRVHKKDPKSWHCKPCRYYDRGSCAKEDDCDHLHVDWS